MVTKLQSKSDIRPDVLLRALNEARQILSAQKLDPNEVHDVKSALYAAIERAGMRIEKLSYFQRLLRDLFSIVELSGEIREHERKTGVQILDELNQRYHSHIQKIGD